LKRSFSKKIVLVLIILGLALLYAGSRVKVIEFGYEVSKIKAGVSDMERENALLKSKVAQARSTEKLIESAKRLGFAAPETHQVLFLRE